MFKVTFLHHDGTPGITKRENAENYTVKLIGRNLMTMMTDRTEIIPALRRKNFDLALIDYKLYPNNELIARALEVPIMNQYSYLPDPPLSFRQSLPS